MRIPRYQVPDRSVDQSKDAAERKVSSRFFSSVNFGFSNGRRKQTDFDGCEGDRGLVELVVAQGRGQEVDGFCLSQLRFIDARFKFKSDW
ncbi:hypothetical protein RUM44_008651 [Polyplax serrata]|uniref:Uncharacterized protein n=1 Tax=Polyplax serrata TaxID=468196 RepID=A0ABR1BD29_POLSC